jgi:hypothetical protein
LLPSLVLPPAAPVAPVAGAEVSLPVRAKAAPAVAAPRLPIAPPVAAVARPAFADGPALAAAAATTVEPAPALSRVTLAGTSSARPAGTAVPIRVVAIAIRGPVAGLGPTSMRALVLR